MYHLALIFRAPSESNEIEEERSTIRVTTQSAQYEGKDSGMVPPSDDELREDSPARHVISVSPISRIPKRAEQTLMSHFNLAKDLSGLTLEREKHEKMFTRRRQRAFEEGTAVCPAKEVQIYGQEHRSIVNDSAGFHILGRIYGVSDKGCLQHGEFFILRESHSSTERDRRILCVSANNHVLMERNAECIAICRMAIKLVQFNEETSAAFTCPRNRKLLAKYCNLSSVKDLNIDWKTGWKMINEKTIVFSKIPSVEIYPCSRQKMQSALLEIMRFLPIPFWRKHWQNQAAGVLCAANLFGIRKTVYWEHAIREIEDGLNVQHAQQWGRLSMIEADRDKINVMEMLNMVDTRDVSKLQKKRTIKLIEHHDSMFRNVLEKGNQSEKIERARDLWWNRECTEILCEAHTGPCINSKFLSGFAEQFSEFRGQDRCVHFTGSIDAVITEGMQIENGRYHKDMTRLIKLLQRMPFGLNGSQDTLTNVNQLRYITPSMLFKLVYQASHMLWSTNFYRVHKQYQIEAVLVTLSQYQQWLTRIGILCQERRLHGVRRLERGAEHIASSNSRISFTSTVFAGIEREIINLIPDVVDLTQGCHGEDTSRKRTTKRRRKGRRRTRRPHQRSLPPLEHIHFHHHYKHPERY